MGNEAYLVMEGETSCITDGQTFLINVQHYNYFKVDTFFRANIEMYHWK